MIYCKTSQRSTAQSINGEKEKEKDEAEVMSLEDILKVSGASITRCNSRRY